MIRVHSVSWTSTRRSTLRRPSVTSMVMSFKARGFVSAGARRVAEAATAAELAVVARTASIAVNPAICPATVRSQRNQESLVVAAEAVAVTASTAVSQVTCPATVTSQRNPENQVAVVAAAVTASTVASLVICLANVISLGNLVSLRDLAADLAAENEDFNLISREA